MNNSFFSIMAENYTSKERDEKYNRWARKMPTTITISLPLLLIIYVFFDPIIETSEKELLSVTKVLLYFTTIASSFFFFGMFILREVGTLLERFPFFRFREYRLLSDKNGILHEKTKNDIREHIRGKYNDGDKIVFNCNQKEDKIRLKDIVNQIKEDTRGSSILFEYQCVYGFFRNLTGGMLLNFLSVLTIKILFGISHQWKCSPAWINAITEKAESLTLPVNMADTLTVYLFISILMLLVCWICTFRNSKRYAEKLFVTFEKIVRN